MSTPGIEAWTGRELTPPDPVVLAAASGPAIDPGLALPLADLDRLLDPAPLAAETGWCMLPDGVGYIACRTAMPQVTGAMADWWFDWHADDPDRYRAWHPLAHRGNRIDRPVTKGAKAHWGAVHHPVETLGDTLVHARIAFVAPTALGFSTDALDDPRVATIVCGLAGDDRRRARHTVMAHVFLRDGDGVVLRSRFWIGAAIRPDLPGALGDLAGRALNRPAVRRRLVTPALTRALAGHCAEEFAHLAAVLPELHARYGG